MNYFFIIDISIAAAILAVVLILYRTNRMGRFSLILFFIGAGLGFTWELGCNIQMILSLQPVAVFLRPLPIHFLVLVFTHSIWDGGIFLAGMQLVSLVCGKPVFTMFKSKELLVLLLWGQAQELCVELISTAGAGWEWCVYWWNPAIFYFQGHAITLLPQLIWFAACIVFYPLALAVNKGLSREVLS